MNNECTGDIKTCQAMSGECMECGKRDCQKQDSMHYHHDGCPSCGGAYDDRQMTEQEEAEYIEANYKAEVAMYGACAECRESGAGRVIWDDGLCSRCRNADDAFDYCNDWDGEE